VTDALSDGISALVEPGAILVALGFVGLAFRQNRTVEHDLIMSLRRRRGNEARVRRLGTGRISPLADFKTRPLFKAGFNGSQRTANLHQNRVGTSLPAHLSFGLSFVPRAGGRFFWGHNSQIQNRGHCDGNGLRAGWLSRRVATPISTRPPTASAGPSAEAVSFSLVQWVALAGS
jgi:hypothetical protein